MCLTGQSPQLRQFGRKGQQNPKDKSVGPECFTNRSIGLLFFPIWFRASVRSNEHAPCSKARPYLDGRNKSERVGVSLAIDKP
jgi:hypothetical protein